MIEKWVIFKRDYLEISFLRENCGYDGSDERRRIVYYTKIKPFTNRLKTLFNIVEAPFRKKWLNFDVCVVWCYSDGPISSQE